MSDKISINGHDIMKRQIGAKEYKISVFHMDKPQFQFNNLLQPTGKDDALPTYQLTNKSPIIPSWIKQNMNLISDWIKESIKNAP